MKSIAKISAWVLIGVGVLLIVGSLVLVGVGAFRLGGLAMTARVGMNQRMGLNGRPLNFSGLGLLGGAALFIYGLLVATFGEVVYLVAERFGELKAKPEEKQTKEKDQAPARRSKKA